MSTALSTSSLPLGSISNHLDANRAHPVTNNFVHTETQTTQPTTLIQIKLKNLQAYAQLNNDSDLYALVSLDEIALNNQVSGFKPKSVQTMEELVGDLSSSQILLQFKKKHDDPACRAGLLDIIVEDFAFEIDVPTLNGIVDFIEDDVDANEQAEKNSLPVNIRIINSQFTLSADNSPNTLKNNIAINELYVNKLSTNETVISDFFSNFNLREEIDKAVPSSRKKRVKSISLDNYIDLKMMQKCEGPKDEQLASLVYLLRKSKEEGMQLRAQLESEVSRNAARQAENEQLLVRLDEANKSNATNIPMTVDSSPNTAQLELERKQFESLLITYQDENESLKLKLKKADDLVEILNIERDCLLKKLNEQLRSSKR